VRSFAASNYKLPNDACLSQSRTWRFADRVRLWLVVRPPASKITRAIVDEQASDWGYKRHMTSYARKSVEDAWRPGDDDRGLDMAACEGLGILGLIVTRCTSTLYVMWRYI
jgi:hypothetical protein